MAKQMLPASFSPDEGHIMSPGELLAIDIFADVGQRQLEKFPGTVVKREFDKGEVICREGEGGTTAFYIVEGQVEIFIGRRVGSHGPKRRSSLSAMIGRLFGQKRQPASLAHGEHKLVPIDATVDLEYGKLATTLGAGEVFGEMSCLNLAPRSATVIARERTVCLEVLRNMSEMLQRSATFKARMDANYRGRALASHLRNVALFDRMEQADLDTLCETAELISVDPGQPIFHEGDDAADANTGGLYIIRLGQVKVAQKAPGGDRTLAYLTKGDCFGETGLLRSAKRNATCTAVDHPVLEGGGRKRRSGRIELVRITADRFAAIMEKYPQIKGRLEQLAELRLRHQQKLAVSTTAPAPPRRAEDLGLLQGQNLMLIDLERCTRCDQCVDACVSAHDDGVTRLVREGQRYDKYLVPSSCRMCMDPVCMIGCPVGSIRRTENLNIFIEDWCIGCGLCAQQCPYDSIQMHKLQEFGQEVTDEFARVAEGGNVVAVTERAAVCDQCSDLPTGPACVYACPHDAAVRVDARKFLALTEVTAETKLR